MCYNHNGSNANSGVSAIKYDDAVIIYFGYNITCVCKHV